MIEIKIPQLGVSMEEGTLSSWYVEDGAQVQAGQVLYLLETDKVESEVEAPVAGTVRLIGVPGESYAVGVTVAELS